MVAALQNSMFSLVPAAHHSYLLGLHVFLPPLNSGLLQDEAFDCSSLSLFHWFLNFNTHKKDKAALKRQILCSTPRDLHQKIWRRPRAIQEAVTPHFEKHCSLRNLIQSHNFNEFITSPALLFVQLFNPSYLINTFLGTSIITLHFKVKLSSLETWPCL